MFLKKQPTTGISALGTSERYPKTRLQLLKTRQKPSDWWEKSWIIFLMMILLSAADYVNLYVIFSDVLAQNPAFLMIFTGVMCLMLNFLPVIYARLLRWQHDQMADVHPVFLILIPAVFIVLVGIIWWIRFSTRNLEFYTENLMQSIGGTGTVSQQADSSPAAVPMVFILTFLPVCTAAINFFLAWIGADPLVQKIHKLEIHRLHLFENIVELEACLTEYANGEVYNRLSEEDQAKYEAALNTIQSERYYLSDYFRARLAEHLGNPASTLALSIPHTGKPDSSENMPLANVTKSPILEGTE